MLQKHRLDPLWLADPSNIQLIDSYGALDAESNKLKVSPQLPAVGKLPRSSVWSLF